MLGNELPPGVQREYSPTELDQLNDGFNRYINLADNYDHEYHLTESVGITDPTDNYLFHVGLACRILQEAKSDADMIIGQTVFDSLEQITVEGENVKRGKRIWYDDILEYGNSIFRRFSQKVYGYDRHPFDILTAINDLVLQNTDRNPKTHLAEFKPKPDSVRKWSSSWQSRLSMSR